MFEAGLRSFAAFSSNKTRPVSSETTLTPTIAGESSGLRSMSVIRLWSSASVFVGFEVFGPELTGVAEAAGATTGDCEGAGVGDGDGVTDARAGAVDLRSRCALAVKFATGIVANRSTSNRIDFVFFIT